MNVNPGELTKKIDIITLITGRDDEGYPVESETIKHSCWAKKSQSSGSELLKAGADFVDSKTRFLIRYTSTVISEGMFVKYQGKKYDIEYVHEYEDSHEYVEIFCSLKEVVSNG